MTGRHDTEPQELDGAKERARKFFEQSQVDFEFDFFEGVLHRTPNNVDVLRRLGDLYTRHGRYTQGLRIDKRLVALVPEDRVAWYNLACSYALLELPDLAFRALHRSVELGFHDVEHMLEDSDLENIRADQRFDALIDRLTQPG